MLKRSIPIIGWPNHSEFSCQNEEDTSHVITRWPFSKTYQENNTVGCSHVYWIMKLTTNIWVKREGGVKCTPVQALRLCTGRTVHRGSRGITLPFHDHGTRSGWGVSVTPRPFCTPGKDPVPIIQKVGWAPGPVWAGCGKSHLYRDSIPGRPNT